MSLRPLGWIGLLCVSCMLAGSLAGAADEDAATDDTQEATALTKKWHVLHPPMRGTPTPSPLPEDSPLESLTDLAFEGPRPGHDFILGVFSVSGEWGLKQGRVQPIAGEDTALRITNATDFELEGIVTAEGLGGWFILVGWDGLNGYCVSNVQMKTAASGSPWGYFRIENGKAVESSHGEISRFAWKDAQALRMSVVEGKLYLKVGKQEIAKELNLENYAGGDIIFGTYGTKYGAKPVAIHSLRIRAR